MRVALIPTGDLELGGLALALGRAFPDHDFHTVAFSVDPPLPRPFRSFTSARLPLASLREPDSSLSELVGAVVDQLYPEPSCDFVVVLDDLELFNTDNVDVVVDEFRGAVARHLQRIQARDPAAVTAVRGLLRTSASFHLAVPMIESWLFADPQGPSRAEAPPERLPPRLLAGRDPERFMTDDLDYSRDEGHLCTQWRALPAYAQTKSTPEWLKPTHPREEHPKRYMAWLCRAPNNRRCSTYCDEHGARALAELQWSAALSNPDHMCFLRSLVVDLADALACRPSLWHAGCVAPSTSIHHIQGDPILRNI